MIIPDYVKIEFTAKNELHKKDFIAQSFIISIASLVFLSCCYLLLKSFVNKADTGARYTNNRIIAHRYCQLARACSAKKNLSCKAKRKDKFFCEK